MIGNTNMKHKTHHQQLLELHKKGNWVCSTSIEYIRDHRKRYSELSTKGFVFEGEPCDGFCGTKHTSKVFMRRLVQSATKTVTKVVEKDGKYYPIKVEVPLLAL